MREGGKMNIRRLIRLLRFIQAHVPAEIIQRELTLIVYGA